jgi:hypothetical protein
METAGIRDYTVVGLNPPHNDVKYSFNNNNL